MRAFEHRVVTEQVGGNAGARQARISTLWASISVNAACSRLLLCIVQVRNQLRAFAEHPVQPAISVLRSSTFSPCVAKCRWPSRSPTWAQCWALASLMCLPARRGCSNAGLPASSRKATPSVVRRRARAGRSDTVEHVEQFDEERHFCDRAAFNQGQDELALLQADKKIGVFATSGNPLEVKQASSPIGGKKGFQLGPSQGGKHRHG